MVYKVSIITPCYNITKTASKDEKIYKKSLESVINQTIGYSNIEHILIDDCSTDNTKKILDELANRYSNIKLFSTPTNTNNPGTPRNLGIKHATSKYVMFLDSDDILKEDACEVLYNKITTNNVDMVNTNYYIFDGHELFKNTYSNENQMILKPEKSNFMCMIPFIWTKIYYKEFLLENNIIFPPSNAEDVAFLIDCIIATKKDVITLNNFYSIIHNVDDNDSFSHSFTYQKMSELLKVYTESLDKIIEDNQIFSFINDFYQESVISILHLLITTSAETKKNKKEMIRLLKVYFEQYENIPLNLPLFYKFMKLLVKYNQKGLFILISSIIQNVFNTNWFRKLFRNKNNEKD